MSDKKCCLNCEAGLREIWVLFGTHRRPLLVEVSPGNYMSLMRCEQCNSLWCESPYDPYLSFSYAVRWHSDEQEWHEAQHRDSGIALLDWHARALKTNWKSVPPAELAQIEWHRRRTGFGHNPFDWQMPPRPSVKWLLVAVAICAALVGGYVWFAPDDPVIRQLPGFPPIPVSD